MRIGSGEQRFAELRAGLARPAVEIEPTFVEMADLDGVEAIDFLEKTSTDGGAKNEEWMRCKTKNLLTETCSQRSQIGKSAKAFNVCRPDIQKDNVCSLQPHLGCLDEQDPHRRGIGENFSSIKNLVVQCNGERAKAERACPFEQLMSGVIE